jgi:hypothetical protein
LPLFLADALFDGGGLVLEVGGHMGSDCGGSPG